MRRVTAATLVLVTADGTRLAGKNVCARADCRALNKAAACNGCGTRTDCTATQGLFAKGVAARSKTGTGCDDEKNIFN